MNALQIILLAWALSCCSSANQPKGDFQGNSHQTDILDLHCTYLGLIWRSFLMSGASLLRLTIICSSDSIIATDGKNSEYSSVTCGGTMTLRMTQAKVQFVRNLSWVDYFHLIHLGGDSIDFSVGSKIRPKCHFEKDTCMKN